MEWTERYKSPRTDCDMLPNDVTRCIASIDSLTLYTHTHTFSNIEMALDYSRNLVYFELSLPQI